MVVVLGNYSRSYNGVNGKKDQKKGRLRSYSHGPGDRHQNVNQDGDFRREGM